MGSWGRMRWTGAKWIYKLVDETSYIQNVQSQDTMGTRREKGLSQFGEAEKSSHIACHWIPDYMDYQEFLWQIRATGKRGAWVKNQVAIAFQDS